jgi:prolyl-tRNA editing enzyme YbaK/EbsC (Cys-tRNA(Pro) deacylase)
MTTAHGAGRAWPVSLDWYHEVQFMYGTRGARGAPRLARLAPPDEEAPRVRSCDDVHDELVANGIPHEILQLQSSSRTAELAAEALGVDVGDVVKSLLFILDDERPVLALVTGDTTVDADALACVTGASEVRLARAREVRESTGYRPGAVPPCALATDVLVVADPGVFTPEVVYCGGGTTTTMLKVRGADLDVLLGAQRAPIADRGPTVGADDTRAGRRTATDGPSKVDTSG